MADSIWLVLFAAAVGVLIGGCLDYVFFRRLMNMRRTLGPPTSMGGQFPPQSMILLAAVATVFEGLLARRYTDVRERFLKNENSGQFLDSMIRQTIIDSGYWSTAPNLYNAMIEVKRGIESSRPLRKNLTRICDEHSFHEPIQDKKIKADRFWFAFMTQALDPFAWQQLVAVQSALETIDMSRYPDPHTSIPEFKGLICHQTAYLDSTGELRRDLIHALYKTEPAYFG